MFLDDLRRFAVARSLFTPTTLKRALNKLGFVQADPIRAPARAQDLTLRHRVKDYCAGDLERRYATLGVEEDTFINYGVVSSEVYALMHPRTFKPDWSASQRKRVQALLEFVRARGSVHPRDVDAHFSHGRVTNYWGGSSSATTHLMDAMHYRGLLRVARRERGIRTYATGSAGLLGPREKRADAATSSAALPAYARSGFPRAPARLAEAPETRADAATDSTALSNRSAGLSGPRATIDELVDVLVRKYAPLPGASLSNLVRRLRYAGRSGLAS
jgi:hypothetical protein